MSRPKKSDPQWRVHAAAEVMAGVVPQLALSGRVLLAGEVAPPLIEAVKHAGGEPVVWQRNAAPGSAASAWPPDGTSSAALLRLPRAKDELEMMLHAVAARVAAGGPILVYGANDEGIRSAAVTIEPVLGPVETIEHRAHCRVLGARRPAAIAGLRGELVAWRHTAHFAIGAQERNWTVYPGVFAKGGLDDGTRLLLGTLDRVDKPPATALDFGCGIGVIAAALHTRHPATRVTMLDRDALAIAAARENVPEADAQIGAALAELGQNRFDLIVANPPIHVGKAEDYTVLGKLIAQAPAHLTPHGALLLVVQKRVPTADWLTAAFEGIERWADDGRYVVWHVRAPKRTNRAALQARLKTTGAHSSAARGRGR